MKSGDGDKLHKKRAQLCNTIEFNLVENNVKFHFAKICKWLVTVECISCGGGMDGVTSTTDVCVGGYPSPSKERSCMVYSQLFGFYC